MHRWMEITCAAVLALATTASAWCAYESTLWGGVQTFRLEEMAHADRKSSQKSIEALQLRAFDAQMVISFIEAKASGNEKLATILHDRFRPEAMKALDAWLKIDPFHNPKAPKRPFEMAEYVQPELVEAKHLEQNAELLQGAAQIANQHSDRYVLLTVMFASVLFFGGISGTFHSDRLKWVAIIVTLTLFLVTVVAMMTMPICRE